MKHRIPRPALILILLLLLGSLGYAIYYYSTLPQETTITASGSVEALEISISTEMNGKVSEVLKELGDPAADGETLLRLDGTVLMAQRKVAEANLTTAQAADATAIQAVALAQAQLDSAREVMDGEDRKLRMSNWGETAPTEFDQPIWYFSLNEEFEALVNAEKDAKSDLENAKKLMEFVEEKSASGSFIEAEKRLARARLELVVAQDVNDQVGDASENADLRTESDKLLDDAKLELTGAQGMYDETLVTEGAKDVLEARARFQVAQSRLDVIQARLLGYKTGDRSTKVKLAEIALAVANSQKIQAGSNVDTALANLGLIDAQIQKLVITSPVNGTIQLRNVDAGEVVNPGMTVFTIVNLSKLYLTVYIAEDRYGDIRLGQKVEISADSFPGKIFQGEVIQIGTKAEFTPRNVQTADGRKTTVFAIKISLNDPDGLLKPGMPTDVTFK